MQTVRVERRWWYPYWVRWQVLARSASGFARELAGHPVALVGAITIALYIAVAVLAQQIAPHDPTTGDLAVRLEQPVWAGGSWAFWLGTDAQGRDLWSRIVYGSRISLWVGFLATAVSATIGVAIGCIAGYHRGTIDELFSRFADLLLAFPYLIFAIAVMAFLGPGLLNLIMAMIFKGWVEFFRLTRAEMLSEKTKEYVAAAKSVSRTDAGIIVFEILPNIFHSVLVLATLRMGFFIVMEASLSFLGIGIQPPTPAWGSMVAEGRDYMTIDPWLSTLPGMAILFLVLAINVFGEGLRDILDPRLKVV
jgi:peptide/nickel transport system permease protein